MINPTYADYATHDESQFPELWEGTVFSAAPCLGATGLRLFDTSRRNNWGVLTGMDPPTDWVVSGGQMALDFDGVNDEVVSSINLNLYPVVQLSAWVWTSRASSSFAIMGNDNGSFGRVVRASADNFEVLTTQSNWNTLIPIPMNQWFHISVLWSTSSVKLYLNGTLSGSTSGESATYNDATTTSFGATGPGGAGQKLLGMLDDLQIYNRELNPAEIRLLASRRGIAYQRRKRRYAFNATPSFLAAWARNSNVLIQPGVA